MTSALTTSYDASMIFTVKATLASTGFYSQFLNSSCLFTHENQYKADSKSL
jgi:hypothetical protein